MVEENFSWLPFFEELLDIICNKYNPHTLYSEFKKLVPEEQYNDINQMDPLTFIGCICAGNRIAINRAALVKKNFNMKSNPISDINGIPNFVHGTYKYFHEIYKGADISDVMQILWDFARQINENNINEETFNTIVNFNEVKVGKLSQIMYICKPRSFYTCDSTMLSYLYNNIENNYKSFLEIQVYCKTLNTAPYILSAKAWKYSCRRKDFFDYIKKINKPSYDDFISRQILSEKFEKEIFNFSGKRLFDVKNIKDIETLLEKLKNNEDWNKYDKSHGNGIPNAILNTHYKNFINGTEEKILLSAKKYWIYQPGEQGRLWDDVYTNNIIAIGWEELGDLKQYNSEENLAEKIKEIYSKKSNPDKLANWEFANVMNIGDIVYVKKGLKDLIGRGIVQSDYYFDDTRKEYKSVRKIQWTHNGTYSVDFSKLGIKQWVQKTLTDISEDKYKDFCLKIEDIFMNNNQNEQDNIIPLNQILYGPPGTGKTYKTKTIVNDIIKNNKQKNKNINFDFSNMTWHEAIAIGMYNHKQEWYSTTKLKVIPEIQMIYEIKNNKNLGAALWAYMQQHTSPDIETVKYSNRYEPFLFEKNTDSKWKLTDEGRKYVEENLSTYIQVQDSDEKIEYCRFITFHQSYAYEDFIEGIKPDCKEDVVIYNIQKGVFKDICLRANNDPENNYVIIIDEINRGNISKIFGELITLIEPDKRIIPNGEYSFENTEELENQLLVTLPYSQKKFGVPKNLYIIGTMNTSDRSIASIDIALRRRFKFKEMMPNSNFVADFGICFNKIFDNLNNKIKLLLDRDHQIGHSYFINTKYNDSNGNNNTETLKDIWFSEILPLLNEYFYCDWEKLKLIIPGFIKKLDVPEVLKNECDDFIYEFKTFDEVSNFEKTLNQEKFEQV